MMASKVEVHKSILTVESLSMAGVLANNISNNLSSDSNIISNHDSILKGPKIETRIVILMKAESSYFIVLV